jgi:hypothetical protein
MKAVCLAFCALLLGGAAAVAADLRAVERRLVKEPAYQKTPLYCLLVFGPEAKTRVWLVLDGDVLYVDRNGSGDLTEAGERLRLPRFGRSFNPARLEERAVEIGTIREGDLEHTGLRLTQYRVRPDFQPVPWRVPRTDGGQEQLKAFGKENPQALVHELSISIERRPRPGDKVRIAGHVEQGAGSDAQGFLQFAARPAEAPIIHFNGPLRMGLPFKQVLGRDRVADFMTVIGSPGLGAGAFAVIDPSGLILADVHPVADVRFPAARPGGAPIKARVTLPYRINVSWLYGPVRVPPEAGDGPARVTLSFDDCDEVRVGRAEVEVGLGVKPK